MMQVRADYERCPRMIPLTFCGAEIGDYRCNQIAYSAPIYPRLSHATPRHAHSSIFGYLNALIFQRNFFRSRVAIRTAHRQKFLVLIFNRKSRDSDSTTFQRLSTTIGRFFASTITHRVVRPAREIPSSL